MSCDTGRDLIIQRNNNCPLDHNPLHHHPNQPLPQPHHHNYLHHQQHHNPLNPPPVEFANHRRKPIQHQRSLHLPAEKLPFTVSASVQEKGNQHHKDYSKYHHDSQHVAANKHGANQDKKHQPLNNNDGTPIRNSSNVSKRHQHHSHQPPSHHHKKPITIQPILKTLVPLSSSTDSVSKYVVHKVSPNKVHEKPTQNKNFLDVAKVGENLQHYSNTSPIFRQQILQQKVQKDIYNKVTIASSKDNQHDIPSHLPHLLPSKNTQHTKNLSQKQQEQAVLQAVIGKKIPRLLPPPKFNKHSKYATTQQKEQKPSIVLNKQKSLDIQTKSNFGNQVSKQDTSESDKKVTKPNTSSKPTLKHQPFSYPAAANVQKRFFFPDDLDLSKLGEQDQRNLALSNVSRPLQTKIDFSRTVGSKNDSANFVHFNTITKANSEEANPDQKNENASEGTNTSEKETENKKTEKTSGIKNFVQGGPANLTLNFFGDKSGNKTAPFSKKNSSNSKSESSKAKKNVRIDLRQKDPDDFHSIQCDRRRTEVSNKFTINKNMIRFAVDIII